mmetsp:Transcript_89560/g.196240  ORF Transcript_89560/g.196240 Transcript_89560/m.196240 type:complete len:98 (+) Transcript_89560:45-338(+)
MSLLLSSDDVWFPWEKIGVKVEWMDDEIEAIAAFKLFLPLPVSVPPKIKARIVKVNIISKAPPQQNPQLFARQQQQRASRWKPPLFSPTYFMLVIFS